MKWLVFGLFIMMLITIAVLLYKVIPQIFSYKMKNPITRRWCALHNRYYLEGTTCPRCRHFESMEN